MLLGYARVFEADSSRLWGEGVLPSPIEFVQPGPHQLLPVVPRGLRIQANLAGC